MLHSKLRYSANQILVAVIISLYMSSILMGSIVWNSDLAQIEIAKILKLMRYLAYSLAIFKFALMRKYQKGWIWTLLFLIAIVTFSMIGSENNTYFLFILIYCSVIGEDVDYLIKCTSVTQLLIIALTLLGVLFGFVSNYRWEHGGRIQYFCGFDYSNILPGLYLFLLFQYVYLRKGRLCLKEFIVFMTIAYGVFKATTSRVNFALSVGVLMLFLFYRIYFYKGKLIRKFKKVIISLPFTIMIFSILVAVNYDAGIEIWRRLDVIFSGRLSLAHNGLIQYGITILGQSINWIGITMKSLLQGGVEKYSYVDNAYLKTLFEFGILFLFIVLLMYSVLLKKSIERKEYYLTWIIIFILLDSVVEARLIHLGMNPFVLLSACQIFYKEKKEPREYRTIIMETV